MSDESPTLVVDLPATPTSLVSLEITVEDQRLFEWCWASVASALAVYYAARFGQGTAMTQGDVAALILQDARFAASPPPPAPCDKPASMRKVLEGIGHLARTETRPATIEEVRAEIDAGRPLVARIAWEDGSGHFVVLAGYVRGTDEVFLRDPEAEDGAISLSRFPNDYRDGGTWTHTYWTA